MPLIVTTLRFWGMLKGSVPFFVLFDNIPFIKLFLVALSVAADPF